jgi:site-specific recombinase XerD
MKVLDGAEAGRLLAAAAGDRFEVQLVMALATGLRQGELFVAEGHVDGPVFCNTEDGFLRRSNFIRQVFKPVLKKAGLPDIRFHDLRHTSATLLPAQGVCPRVAQERLGHSQIG